MDLRNTEAEVLQQAPPPARQQAAPLQPIRQPLPPRAPPQPSNAGHQQPAEPADTASAGPQAAVCEAGAGSSAGQPLPPHHRQPAAWQRQLSSGISFGSGREPAAASGGASAQAPDAAAAAASSGPGPSDADTQQAQLPARSAGGRAVFTGRGFRLGGGSDAGAADLENGDDEVTSARRRTMRQRLPDRWAGRGNGPEQ